ncbi:glycosyltransferase [Ilumatobacter sp.]|uniref:glycosyltransferase n=1 Tax=Ilumatobacter sp. TaxID=1967498 RepID=UPI003B51C89F
MHHPEPARTTPAGRPGAPSIAIVTTFAPTSCGIATFSAALSRALADVGASVSIVRCEAAPDDDDPIVLASLSDPADRGRSRAIAVLDASDVVIVQHEYGIYDGTDGEAVVELLDTIAAPIVVVAHTVLTEPMPNQRRVLERVCAAADAVVVMTETARDRLRDGYDVDIDAVRVIPHGAATPPALAVSPGRGGASDPGSAAATGGEPADSTGTAHEAATGSQPARRPRLLTWGLLGPGKGIEWAIDAIAGLADLDPRPVYVVAGATHPKVAERDGEEYREMLLERAEAAGVDVVADDTYRDLASLTDLIRSADLVVLPYDSRDQVTSGVLVDAVAAGRPVVSTAFPHAVELLTGGAGIVVGQRDPDALGAAIRSVLTDDDLAASMAAEARRLAPDLAWGAVARRHLALADEVAARRRAAS